MAVIIFFSIISWLICYRGTKTNNKYCLIISFSIITIIQMLRYDYGNDYWDYYDMYNSIVGLSFNYDAIIAGDVWKEPGFAFLCYLSKYLGGYNSLLIIVSVLEAFAYYRLIKMNVPKAWIPLAFFIYAFNTDFYLLNFSMVRQGLAIAIFTLAFPYLNKKKFVTGIALVLLSLSLHTSAKILVPFVFWGFLPQKSAKYWPIFASIIFVILIFSASFIQSVLSTLMIFEDVEVYMKYYGDLGSEATYGLGFVLNSIPLIICLYYLFTNTEKDIENKRMIMLATIGALLVPFNTVLPMLSRVAIYFSSFSIATIPLVYSSLNKKGLRVLVISILVLMTFYSYVKFFTDSIYSVDFQNYKTIFSSL